MTEKLCATVRPKTNSLSLLRTCRQINQEIGSRWLGKALFSFETLPDMLDKLMPLPPTTLSKIRHVRTGSYPVDINIVQITDQCASDALLTLLQSMRLDTLTVFGPCYPLEARRLFDALIRHGNGWKELHYITLNANMLFCSEPNGDPTRPVPAAYVLQQWNDALTKRDGDKSGAHISIYQKESRYDPAAHTRPRYSIGNHVFAAELPNFQDNPGPAYADWNYRELLCIAKRGRRAVLTGLGGNPHGAQPWPPHGVSPLLYRTVLHLKYPDVENKVAIDEYTGIYDYWWSTLRAAVIY
jgi:hypothetical protein